MSGLREAVEAWCERWSDARLDRLTLDQRVPLRRARDEFLRILADHPEVEAEPQECRECGKSASACGRSGNFCCAECSRTRFSTHDSLAQHDAEVGARALREAADEAEFKFRSMTFYRDGGTRSRLHPVGQWLRARADALTTDTAGGAS